PAALLQPVGSNGNGGTGLSVGASTADGSRAFFSNTGSHLSLVAPGERVFGAVSSTASPAAYTTVTLPGSATGLYGVGSGTSFSAPEGAGAGGPLLAAPPPPAPYPPGALPGWAPGLYGFGSGTSFSAPEVAGAAALVMAANPLLPA